MAKKDEIEVIKNKILPILKEHKITNARIFGSFVRGEQKKKSDVDLLIEIDKDVSLFGVAELKRAIEKILREKIDLVEYDLIRKELKENILNDEILILR